ncbi:MAG TPA: hypothetical protein VM366_18750 [Anaerolineae bacterium]|nr:hypothetical protein [Anaerolineae bacterium]
MAEQASGPFSVPIRGPEDAAALVGRLSEAAQPSAVFGEPVTSGERTVITACEVTIGLGFGYGMSSAGGEQPVGEGDAEGEAKGQPVPAVSGGGGGGGNATARPVAVIHVGPEGVEVEPVVDVTKLGLAFFTMLGSIFLMAGKMRKAAKKL